jgi:bacterioferritin (cytochrome b1)
LKVRTNGNGGGARNRTEVVEELNRLMAEEAEACLRYFQVRFRLRGIDREAAATFFNDGLRETLEHAEAIASQIRALGHVPSLHVNLSLSGGPMSLADALAEVLEVEQQALDAYKEFLPRVSGQPGLEDFIRRQIEVETGHVQEIVDALRAGGPLKLVGRPEP